MYCIAQRYLQSSFHARQESGAVHPPEGKALPLQLLLSAHHSLVDFWMQVSNVPKVVAFTTQFALCLVCVSKKEFENRSK